MTEQREELAQLLFVTDNYAAKTADALAEYAHLKAKDGDVYTHPMADAAIAAGWSKPRIIATIQELATLKSDAVVRDSDCRVLELMWDDGGQYWSGMGDGDFFRPPTLPATVLYESSP